MAGFLDVNLASGGLIEGKRIVAFLNTLKEDALIESFAKPFTAIASDLQTGREIWLDKGPILDAVRASIAIIAINPNAHNLGPHARSDIVKPAPSRSLSRDSLDKLFESVPDGIRQSLKAITPNFFGSRSGVPGYFDVLSTSIDIMTSQILRSRLAGEPPHVMISPHLSHMSVLEFNRAKEAIEEGRQSAQRAMPLLQEYLS